MYKYRFCVDSLWVWPAPSAAYVRHSSCLLLANDMRAQHILLQT